jgi:hypothetical protein
LCACCDAGPLFLWSCSKDLWFSFLKAISIYIIRLTRPGFELATLHLWGECSTDCDVTATVLKRTKNDVV